MRLKIKRCIELKSAETGKNIRYSIGVRDIPDADCTGWFFDAMVNTGQVELLEDAKPVAVEPEPVAVPDNMPKAPKQKKQKPAAVEPELVIEPEPENAKPEEEI